MAAQPLHLSWSNPVRVHWGAGSLHEISPPGPVVVLADRAALRYDNETRLADRLGDRCLAWSWFQGGLASVEMARELADTLWPVMQANPQATVLAIGGGSTLDLAKVLRYRFQDVQGGQALQQAPHFWRSNSLPADAARHPLWLVPTTAGTGSEVTRWATLWDTAVAQPIKLSWAPADGYAEQAWVDPDLTLTCPLMQSRDCALDALAHALESLWNRHAHPVSEALAVEAAGLVLQNLPVLMQGDVSRDGSDAVNRAARHALARASLLAGMAMSHTQTALAHALSYQLTLEEGVPHGAACAVWLPMAWELAAQVTPSCDAALARIFGMPVTHGAATLRMWLQTCGITPRDLRNSTEGRALLEQELRSARGRNFIAAPN